MSDIRKAGELTYFLIHGIFRLWKAPMNQKPPSEQEFLSRALEQGLRLAPLSIELQATRDSGASDFGIDALAAVEWRGRRHDFALEYKPRSIPSIIQHAVLQVQAGASRVGRYPLVVVPFLDEARLHELERQGVSGIDLCGNGVVTIPGEILVFRTGAPNLFRDSAPIKNIYRGTSSLVGRVLLLKPHHASLTDIQDEILRRGGNITLSTVSKAVKALEGDLIIARKAGAIRVLQPSKLLDRLTSEFRAPTPRRIFRGKALNAHRDLIQMLSERAARHQLRLAVTGVGSANRYSVLAREPVLSLYCTNSELLLRETETVETHRFPTLEIIETADETVYFDRRVEEGCPWASPLQAFVELMHGDKRERESAEPIRLQILAESEGTL